MICVQADAGTQRIVFWTWHRTVLRFAIGVRQSHSIDTLIDRTVGLAPCHDRAADTLSWGIGSLSKSRLIRSLDGEVENTESRASLVKVRLDSAS